MVPVPRLAYRHSSRLLYTTLSLGSHHVINFLRSIWKSSSSNEANNNSGLIRRSLDSHNEKIVFGILIPIFVLLSGLFAGLTLGYMSLDETQLNVLAISGTPKQREYARKIQPIRENGHLLLVTLLLANMIVNESLPIISDPVLGGGVQSVVVSTTLIVIFSEILPQSLFSRHGLYLGAKMVGFTRVLIYGLGVIAWPVAKLLEVVLGPHHGIIYRRSELKELIAMHSSMATHGGDLKTDTVTIIGATLDLQEKVVKQAMTPIKDVFMLSIDSELDYDLLKNICMTGHSRVPVYEEIEVPGPEGRGRSQTQRAKKILGILLVKQCVLLDPRKSVPLRNIPLNKVFFVPQNESLLGILDKFQEGRSHIAIVSRLSYEKAASVKKVVKHSLAQRLRSRVMGDSSDSSDEELKEKEKDSQANNKKRNRTRRRKRDIEEGSEDGETTLKSYRNDDFPPSVSVSRSDTWTTIDPGLTAGGGSKELAVSGEHEMTRSNSKSQRPSFQLPRAAVGMASFSNLEQSMPADAVLTKEGVEELLFGLDPALNPLGIITLEDVLEELIGEEIYDEFDPQGAHGDPYVPPPASAPVANIEAPNENLAPPRPTLKPLSLKGFNFLRSRSAPPSPRDVDLNPPISGFSAPNTARDFDRPPPLPRTYSHSKVEHLGRSPDDDVGNEPEERIVRGPPSIIVEQHSSSDSTPAGSPPEEASPKPVQTIPQDTNATGGKAISKPSVSLVLPTILSPVARTAPSSASHMMMPMIPPGSRSASPAPSLEAILLDRKRSKMGTSGSPVVAATPSSNSSNIAVTPISLRPTSSLPLKGTRGFKSTPLGGGGVTKTINGELKEDVLAENSGTNDESRIPDGKDKEGPDKDVAFDDDDSRFVL